MVKIRMHPLYITIQQDTKAIVVSFTKDKNVHVIITWTMFCYSIPLLPSDFLYLKVFRYYIFY